MVQKKSPRCLPKIGVSFDSISFSTKCRSEDCNPSKLSFVEMPFGERSSRQPARSDQETSEKKTFFQHSAIFSTQDSPSGGKINIGWGAAKKVRMTTVPTIYNLQLKFLKKEQGAMAERIARLALETPCGL